MLVSAAVPPGASAVEPPADPIGRDCVLPAGTLSFPVAVDFALCTNPATRGAWAAARAQLAFALGRLTSAAPLAGSAALP